MSEVVYLDSSAIVKLIARKPETPALATSLQGVVPVSSALARVEVVRALRRLGKPKMRSALAVLDSVSMLAIDEDVIERASALEPVTLRSLDAIHLASALTFGAELEAMVTYDASLAEASRAAGIRVRAPA